MSANFTSETHEFSNFQIFHLKALNGLIAFLKFNPFPLGPLYNNSISAPWVNMYSL